MMLKKRAKVARKGAGGAGSQTPLPVPAETRARVKVEESLHKTASDWGLSPELLKAWNPGAEFKPGDKVFIHPPKVS
jgi:LysM repeat protein